MQRRDARRGDPAILQLQDQGQRLMRAVMSQLNLSARAYHRILKLARTVADLAGCEEIQSVHLAEMLHAAQPSQVDNRIEGDRRKNSLRECLTPFLVPLY